LVSIRKYIKKNIELGIIDTSRRRTLRKEILFSSITTNIFSTQGILGCIGEGHKR
jgi:hypothetical protein